MRLFDAPHRPFFLGGLLAVTLALILWSLWLLGAFAGAYTVPPLTVSAVTMHGFLMIYGIFPFFVFGFLTTTYPRWMQTAPVARRDYRDAFVLRAVGLVLVYMGLVVGRWEIVMGIVIMALGDARLILSLIAVYQRARKPARRGVLVFNLTLAAEIAGLLLYAVSLADDRVVPILVPIRIGLFGFLIPTLFGVSYRMLPFFTASVLPHYQKSAATANLPLIFLAGTALHAVLATMDARAVMAFVDAALAAVAWYHLRLWFRYDVLHHGLLLLLYLGFAWLGLGFILYAVQDAARALGVPILGRGPLHALGLGFALSLVVAMMTRVTRGHSGQRLQSDTVSWGALAGVQVATFLRVAASFPAIDGLASFNLGVLAAPVAVAALLPWAFQYGRILVTTPRGTK